MERIKLPVSNIPVKCEVVGKARVFVLWFQLTVTQATDPGIFMIW